MVVCGGVTAADPLSAGEDTSSSFNFGVMVTAVALVLVHVRVASCPALMVVGETWIVAVGATGAALTVTVTCALEEPPAPLAVMV